MKILRLILIKCTFLYYKELINQKNSNLILKFGQIKTKKGSLNFTKLSEINGLPYPNISKAGISFYYIFIVVKTQ